MLWVCNHINFTTSFSFFVNVNYLYTKKNMGIIMGFTIQLHFFLIQPFFFIPFFFVSISFFSSISFLNVFNTNLGCLCTSHVNWITLMQLSHGLILYLSWAWNQVERFFSYQFHPFFLNFIFRHFFFNQLGCLWTDQVNLVTSGQLLYGLILNLG